ncbi:STY4528 family pathogenicity island replication protein [Orbus mooreae]|uniref:STY4528 family pathogenicity island replication protein n=1 Tax=Orbus mooreae TaxID=3074107 RepID=UPI00370DCBB0
MSVQGDFKKQDGFIYSGNQQESVPRALFFDKRLTPLERNAWQIIRLGFDVKTGISAPTYDYLQQFLTSMPCAEKASTETVARALTILRLTRWLSVIKRRAKDGTKQSNLYILHDSPLTPFEAMRLDEDYLPLVSESMSHASKAIQLVTTKIVEDIANDPFLMTKQLPSRLELLLNRAVEQHKAQTLSTIHPSEGSLTDLLRNHEIPISESEISIKPLKNKPVRNPKPAISSSNIKKILLLDNMPTRFFNLNETQQAGILKIMQQLSAQEQQQVLSEWDDRCHTQKINNPAAYLYGIAQKAIRGELNELLVVRQNNQPTKQSPLLTGETPLKASQDKQKIQAHIDHLKRLLAISK